MRKSSKIILAVCLVLAVLLAAIFVPMLLVSKSDFTQKDADEMLQKLAVAFHQKSTADVLSFASPDAKVAGRDLEQMHDYLQRGLSAVRDLEVRFEAPQYARHGEEVTLDTHVIASEKNGVTYYNAPVRFVVKKRSVPQMWGLLRTYEWKVVEVDAADLPKESGL